MVDVRNQFLEQDPLPTVQSIVTSGDASHQTRAKAMYCLSSTLKHSEPAVERFVELDGWRAVRLLPFRVSAGRADALEARYQEPTEVSDGTGWIGVTTTVDMDLFAMGPDGGPALES